MAHFIVSPHCCGSYYQRSQLSVIGGRGRPVTVGNSLPCLPSGLVPFPSHQGQKLRKSNPTVVQRPPDEGDNAGKHSVFGHGGITVTITSRWEAASNSTTSLTLPQVQS